MRNKERIEAALGKLGIPFQYLMFEAEEAADPPFLVWYYKESANFYADGIVYHTIEKVNIELYTDEKNFILESRLEGILKEEGCTWKKNEGYLDEEQLHETLYELYEP